MIASFIVLAIGFVLHLILVSLAPTYEFLQQFTPWTLAAVIVLAVIFIIFVFVKLFRR